MSTTGRHARYRAPDRLRIAALKDDNSRLGTTPPPTRYRDRRGRGLRGPLLHPALPGWLTRREQFIELVQQVMGEFREKVPEAWTIEFGVEEVPPSDPADWEGHETTLSRSFPRDRRRGLRPRVVLYRLPIIRCNASDQVIPAVYSLLAARTAELLDISPDDLLN
ncbi:metallopeptidase family protein [Actinomycetaceae bacterium MB13-C1-2]|nr:metallopeptidase family protein [Actinomycetaceae bacterium MB13-C1-2]